MSLGMVVLYALFVPVGLWLLTEAMWQHGAPFRYRVLALVGFGGVVAGVAMGNAIVSGAGGVCFVVGQLLVTRQVRRGYYHGWTVRFGRKRARRARHGRPTQTDVAAGASTQHFDAFDSQDPADFVGYGGYEQSDLPAAAYDTGESDRYLYGEDGDRAAPPPPGYAPNAHGQYGPQDGYPSDPQTQQMYVQDDTYADSGAYAVQAAHGPDGYRSDGYGPDGYAPDGYRPDDYGPQAGDDPGAYGAEPRHHPDTYGEFPAQPFPTSSDTAAAPIPAPMSPPPGWAEAPTANRPGTDERFG
ncbi:hypothetical protein [Streptodolium elevatio]|uniref:Uncharacterized protein n=1 Tax=Streptodolium elevatio TaxID=3157996 RepID=A0ABV3DED3_9ACTN